MYKILSLFLLTSIAVSCKKLQYGGSDTKYRNLFAGKWKIDSILTLEPVIISNNILDTNLRLIPNSEDHLIINSTKDQVKKNSKCYAKFLQNVYSFEFQAFNDSGANRWSVNSITSNTSSHEFEKYFTGILYVDFFNSQKLRLNRKFILNGKMYYKQVFLTKE